MSPERPSDVGRLPLSSATLGTVRRMLVADCRRRSSIRSADRRRGGVLRRTIGEILAEPELDLDASPALVAAVEAAVCGLGPLQPLVDDPEVGDILVNGPAEIFVERSGRLESTTVTLGSAREVIELSERIAALAGRELSVAHPVVDARMPDGSRVEMQSRGRARALARARARAPRGAARARRAPRARARARGWWRRRAWRRHGVAWRGGAGVAAWRVVTLVALVAFVVVASLVAS